MIGGAAHDEEGDQEGGDARDGDRAPAPGVEADEGCQRAQRAGDAPFNPVTFNPAWFGCVTPVPGPFSSTP